MSAQALREEREYLATLTAIADVIQEQRALREALELATARQRKTIAALLDQAERKVNQIEDEQVSVVLLN